MPRVKLILNPLADRGHAGEIVHALRGQIDDLAAQSAESYQIDWVETEYAGHAAELAAQAVEDGCDIIISAGGDGTNHEITNGLMRFDPDRRPTLALLPVGSGNDFARNIGLPPTPAEALRRIFEGSVRVVDVGLTDNGAGRSEYWMNTMGIVFPGAMTIVSRQITQLRGFTMYLAAILKTIFSHHTAPHMHIEVDGSVVVDRPVTLFTIANGPREGGGIPVIPDAKPDDGILHWVCIRRVGRLMMLIILPAVMAGKHLGWPQVTHGQGQRYVIDADQAMPIHLDGEIFATWEDDTRHLTIEVLPGALRVLV